MDMRTHDIAPHNRDAARSWGASGADYDFISYGLSDALSWAVQALWPTPGERVLDIATGTGWTANLIARSGARVDAVDIAAPLLEAARRFAGNLETPPEFSLADAEALPFENGTFDAAVSTYGIIFAGEPGRAASELARVVRPGGRIVLLTWEAVPDSYIPAFFAQVFARGDLPAPDPGTGPMAWGSAAGLRELLEPAFEIDVEPVVTRLYAPDADALWAKYVRGFGLMREIADGMEEDALSDWKEAFRALHAPYETPRGLVIDRRALMVRGLRSV